MRYSEYGRTGKQVSVLGFGGMHFDTSRPRAENADLVRYACSLGVNYFDTAPGYCGDESEPIFGEAFRDMPGPFYVSTKGMPTSFDTAGKARDAVRRSLDRLGIPKIDFYHVWCLREMDHYDLAVKPGGQYEGLLQCKEEGLIEHIVCSSHQTGPEVAHILSKDEFEGVLLGVNILNFPYRWDGLVAARDRGIGVVAMNPLAGGAIPQHESEFSFLAREGESATEAALRFNMGCPLITVTLNGFTTREHVDLACRVADSAEPMSEEEVERLRGELGENLDTICTGCGYCKGCPQDIPVANYMQVYNEHVMFGVAGEGMTDKIRSNYSWGVLVGRAADADACTACGQCEDACTQHLPIIKRLAEMAEWEAPLK
ncbi:MAG: aldo/keto reductase [Lentisphaeria bacterium]|nr:aldo/keto reductase [Lentisphaeria bacterium]